MAVNGAVYAADLEAGMVHVERRFETGDKVLLTLPMAPRVIDPDPRIDAVRGSVAIEYGPTVLALESTDLNGADVTDAFIDLRESLTAADGAIVAHIGTREGAEAPWPYQESSEIPRSTAHGTQLVPYRDWAKRGPSTMRVWIPTS